MLVFCLWYEVKSAAFESNKKCGTFKIGQYKLVYLFPFYTTRTFNQALITYHLDYCSILTGCSKAVSPSSNVYMKISSLNILPAMSSPKWTLSLCFIRFSFCFILFTSSATRFLFFYNLLLHCSHSFYFINGHNPFLQFSFFFSFLPVNCGFLPYYSIWRFSLQNLSVNIFKIHTENQFFKEILL